MNIFKINPPILFIFLILGLPTFSQSNLFVSNYDWDSRPGYSINSSNEEPMMALKEKYVVEFAYSEDSALQEYYLEHKALLLNNNDRIDAYNKIYLPYSNTSELLKSKARVITKEGKVIELDDTKILSAQDEETGKYYKYFAFEGVEKGSVIEYFYVEKKQPSYRGTAFRLQNEYDKKNVGFDLFSPSNLVFAFKSYNNLPEISKDSLTKDRSHWKLNLEFLEGLENEAQSPYDASRALLVYKLDRNKAKNLNDISSYGDVSQNIYNYFYTEPTKKARSLIEDFVAQNLKSENQNIEAKIRRLDNIIKGGFYLSNGEDENLKDLEEILSKKVANSNGMMKLYIALLNHLGIEHEIVITSNRETLKFDKEFEAHNFLNDYLIYFPKFETYLSATETNTRYGYPPAWFTDNYGLFVKEVNIGNFKSGVGKIKYIEPLNADKTIDEMVLNVQFDSDDITSNSINIDRSFTGYYAMPIHPYMNQVKDDDRKKLLEGMAKSMNDNVKVEKSKIVNENPELFGIEPLHFVVDVNSNSFVEKAGRKYLFKIGELIGSQIEMYQAKERRLPLENEHTKSYIRTIKVNLPKGYNVANPNELVINNAYEENGNSLFSFNSSYEIEGQTITIKADEFYRSNIIPPSIFEEYRKVINSAADFNKVTLVLEPSE